MPEREISKSHATVLQRRLRNVQKSEMHVQICSGFFAVLVAVTVVVA